MTRARSTPRAAASATRTATDLIAGYVRISDDRYGQRVGVETQWADILTRATELGIPHDRLVRIEDNDLSAWNPRIRRPGLQHLLDGIESGELAGVIVWDIDRFFRQVRELEELIHLTDRVGGRFPVWSARGDLDLSTSEGRMMARVQVTMAQKSSDDTSRRVKRAHQRIAEQGRPAGGNRPFGFEDDRITHRPDEVALIRWAAQQVIDGQSLRAVAHELDQKGSTTPLGNRWRADTIRGVLIRPRVAGMRGQHEAVWDPILEPDLWAQVRRILESPGRRSGGGARMPRVSCLLGIVRCGVCGEPMRTSTPSPGPRNPNPRRRYACRVRGCMAVSIDAKALEEWIGLFLAALVDQLPVTPTVGPDELVEKCDAARTRLATLVDRLGELEERWFLASDGLDRPIYDRLRDDLIVLIEREQADLSRTEGSIEENRQAQWNHRGDLLLKQWTGAGVEVRRALAASLLVAIHVRPVGKGHHGFTPSRLAITTLRPLPVGQSERLGESG